MAQCIELRMCTCEALFSEKINTVLFNKKLRNIFSSCREMGMVLRVR